EELFPDLDVSRTVGWFTALFPLPLTAAHNDDPLNTLQELKELISGIPDHGTGYGLLRYLSPDAAVQGALRRLPASEIHFRYSGQFHRISDHFIFPLDQQEPVMLTGQYRLQILCGIVEEQFHLSVFHNNTMYHRATIEQLTQSFLGTLRSLIAQSRNADRTEVRYTPADFPLAGLDQEQLNALLARLPDIDAG
ncbi:MAG TPA: condensation domain-containing protein, partial [Ktedonobacteraceae bacterium]|nr:condensation domain-containing protein [Ktedonobacteraceae bacterium]